MDEGNDSDVGYGKPPTHSRFKPGQSGNPRGRPKGRKNLVTEINEELARKITIRENGKELSISKRLALVKALVNKGIIKGDSRATELIFALVNAEPDRQETENQQLPAEDDAILQDLITRKVRQIQHTVVAQPLTASAPRPLPDIVVPGPPKEQP